MTHDENSRAAEKPTYLLVHGSWHGAWAWEHLVPELESRGARPVSIDLPGPGRAPGDFTFAGQCDALREAIDSVHGPVVVVAHSYGGVVATEAADRPGVVGVIYLSAFALAPGENIAETIDGLADGKSNADDLSSDGEFITIDGDVAKEAFYHDCDPADVDAAVAHLTPEIPESRVVRPTTAAWQRRPSHFVVCTDDRALPVSAQRRMAERIGAWDEIRSSHSPMLSHPAELADLLVKVGAALDAQPRDAR